METQQFWAFFVIALIVGMSFGMMGATITGAITWPWQRRILSAYEQIETCEDSDGGLSYYTKGAVTYCISDVCEVPKTDYCILNPISEEYTVLREYYCNGNKLAYKDYECEYGCHGGACLSYNSSEVLASKINKLCYSDEYLYNKCREQGLVPKKSYQEAMEQLKGAKRYLSWCAIYCEGNLLCTFLCKYVY